MRIIIALSWLCMAGCVDWAAKDRALAASAGPTLLYFKDARTGFCFAGRELYDRAAVITCVPCSEAVDRAIAEQTAAR